MQLALGLAIVALVVWAAWDFASAKGWGGGGHIGALAVALFFTPLAFFFAVVWAVVRVSRKVRA